MVQNIKAMTPREHELSEELIRLRSTYTFTLGLFLTDFFRKPWKIPFFPILFIFHIISFLKRDRIQQQPPQFSEQKVDPNCLLLFSTSEEGKASFERCVYLAQEWVVDKSKTAILITPHSHLLDSNLNKNITTYPIQDPKKGSKEERGNWNVHCENLYSIVFEAHQPAWSIFDGPFPYRGVLNSTKRYPKTHWIWLRAEGLAEELFETKAEAFDSIIEFEIHSETSGFVQLLRPCPQRTPSDVKPYLLNALAYGSSKVDAERNRIDIQPYIPPQYSIIEPYQLNQNFPSLTPLLSSPHLNQFTCAIVPPNIELVSCLLAANVPLLCIYSERTSPLLMQRLRTACIRQPVLYCHEKDEHQLQLAINTLLNDQKSMRTTAKPLESMNLIKQIIKAPIQGKD